MSHPRLKKIRCRSNNYMIFNDKWVMNLKKTYPQSFQEMSEKWDEFRSEVKKWFNKERWYMGLFSNTKKRLEIIEEKIERLEGSRLCQYERNKEVEDKFKQVILKCKTNTHEELCIWNLDYAKRRESLENEGYQMVHHYENNELWVKKEAKNV